MGPRQQNIKFPWNSMEFSSDPNFHGILCNFFHTPEFYGIAWNSMELLIFQKKDSWNSTELDQFDIQKIIFLNIVVGI